MRTFCTTIFVAMLFLLIPTSAMAECQDTLIYDDELLQCIIRCIEAPPVSPYGYPELPYWECGTWNCALV